jgi:uncharacterized membrane protein
MTSPLPPAGRTSTGFDEKVAGALTYVFGAISGIIFLILERDNAFVRFHARQSTVFFLVVLVVHLLLRGLPVAGAILYIPFIVSVAVAWILLMVKALNGHRTRLPYIGEWVERGL